MARFCCINCRNISDEDKLLTAPNPFDNTDILVGCPICYFVEGFTELCDIPNCNEPAVCGYPTKDGYVRTCSKHCEMK